MSDELYLQSGFLAALSPEVCEKILSLAESFHYDRKHTIFQEGSDSPFIYIVKTGEVCVDIHIPSRGRRTILTAGPGEVVSWSALVQPFVHHASAHALEPTELLGIRGDVLAAVCREDMRVGYELYKALAEIASARLTTTRLQMLDMFATA